MKGVYLKERPYLSNKKRKKSISYFLLQWSAENISKELSEQSKISKA